MSDLTWPFSTYPFINTSLLLLRLMLALIFGWSGVAHVSKPEERSKSIGMPKWFTIFLGVAEIAGALGLATGVFAGWACAGLSLLMLGAIYKKVIVWKTGFWGKGSQGWHYEILLILMMFVILCVGTGNFVLFGGE